MESRSLDACSIVVDTRHLDSPPAFRSQDQRKYAVLRLYPHLRFVSRVRDSPNPQAATTPIKPSPYRLADSAPLPERLRCRQGHPQPCAHAVFHGVGVLENPACRNIPCLQNSYGGPQALSPPPGTSRTQAKATAYKPLRIFLVTSPPPSFLQLFSSSEINITLDPEPFPFFKRLNKGFVWIDKNT